MGLTPKYNNIGSIKSYFLLKIEENLNSSGRVWISCSVCWSPCFAVSSSHACFTCKLIPATWAQKATKGELLFNSVRINFRISFLVGLLCFSWGEKIWLAREGGRLTLLKLYFKTKGGRSLQLFRRLNKPVKNQGSDAHWNTKGGQKVSKKNILKNTKALQSQGAAARWDPRGRLDWW